MTVTVTMSGDINFVWQYNHYITLNSNSSSKNRNKSKRIYKENEKILEKTWVQASQLWY